MTREAWLLRAVKMMRPMFKVVGLEIPEKIQVSVGFPRGKKTIVGQCWSTAAAGDEQTNHLFISPTLDDPVYTLAVLMHELIHASLNCEDGHGGRFAKAAKALGMVGKMTQTDPGESLQRELGRLVEKLGDYGHVGLNEAAPASGPKPQRNRHLKLVCPEDGYTVRTTKKWMELGMPVCPCGETLEESE